jgi:hypothetical protein
MDVGVSATWHHTLSIPENAVCANRYITNQLQKSDTLTICIWLVSVGKAARSVGLEPT